MNASSENEGNKPIGSLFALEGGKAFVREVAPLPVRHGWWQEHRERLPSSINDVTIGPEPSATQRHPRFLLKNFRWLLGRDDALQEGGDRTLQEDGESRPRWFPWKSTRKPMLSVGGMRLFITCYAAYTTLYFTRKPFSVVKEELQSKLGISTLELGWIDTSFLGCYAVGQLLMPLCIADLTTLQLNWLLTGCFFGSFATALAFGCSSSPTSFIALWGINGLVHSPAFPILIRILGSEVPPEARGSVMGAWTTSQQLGGIIATVFCSLIDWGGGWRWVFWFCALMSLFGGLILRVELPKLTFHSSEAGVAGGGVTRCQEAPAANRSKMNEETFHEPVSLHDKSILQEGCTELDKIDLHDGGEQDVGCFVQKCMRDELSHAVLTIAEYVEPLELSSADTTTQVRVAGATSSSAGDPLGAGEMRTPEREETPAFKAALTPSSTKCFLSASPGKSAKDLSTGCNDYAPVDPSPPKLPFRLSGMIVLCSCAYFFVKFVRYTLAFWLPFFLCRHGKLSVTSAGLSSMIFDIGGVVGAVLGGTAADKVFKGRRLTAGALLCVGTGVGLFFVALSSQKLNNLQLEEEGLDLERQVELHSLQRSMQEEWSRLNDNREQPRRREMPQLAGRTETVNDKQPQPPAANRPRPARNESQQPSFNSVQVDNDASSSRQEQMARRGAALGAQKEAGPAERDPVTQETNGLRRRLIVSGSQYPETLLVKPYKKVSKQDSLAPRQDVQAQEDPSSEAGELKQDVDYTASTHAAQGYAATEEDPHFSLTSKVASWYQVVERLDEQHEKRIAALQRTHKERVSSLELRVERERHKLQEGAAWQLTLLLGCMLMVGCFSAVPDSVLGASAAHDLSELPGAVRSNVAAVAAFINAIGALGALCQGLFAASVSELYGWHVLFGLLSLLSLTSAALLLPAVVREGSKCSPLPSSHPS